MKKPNITPGDWRICQEQDDAIEVDTGDAFAKLVAQTFGGREDTKAIAALPKLLEALEKMLARWEALNVENLGPGCRAIAEKSRAALIAAGYTE